MSAFSAARRSSVAASQGQSAFLNGTGTESKPLFVAGNASPVTKPGWQRHDRMRATGHPLWSRRPIVSASGACALDPLVAVSPLPVTEHEVLNLPRRRLRRRPKFHRLRHLVPGQLAPAVCGELLGTQRPATWRSLCPGFLCSTPSPGVVREEHSDSEGAMIPFARSLISR